MAIQNLKLQISNPFDQYVQAYSNLFTTATSTIAATAGFKYKVTVRAYPNESLQTIVIKQPALPDGTLSIDVSQFLRSFVTDDSPLAPILDYAYNTNPYNSFNLPNNCIKFSVYVEEEVNGSVVGSGSGTSLYIAQLSAGSFSIGVSDQGNSLAWDVQIPYGGNQACPVPGETSSTNDGLLTFMPDVAGTDPTCWYPLSDYYKTELTKVQLPRLENTMMPMFFVKWSQAQITNYYPAFSVIHKYYNGNTLLATKSYIIEQCGAGTVTDPYYQGSPYVANTSTQSISYCYKGNSLEESATHVWVSSHVYSDPDVCRGTTDTPALDCNSMDSILAYSEPKPIVAYRIDFVDTCDIPGYSDNNESNRSRFGQLIFMNQLGGWDTIFLNQVRTKYTVKKSTWRSSPKATQYGWYSSTDKLVHVNDVDNTMSFEVKTDFMLDNTETLMKQLYKSPAVYLITKLATDTVYYNQNGGNQYAIQPIRVTVDDTTFVTKRNQTDKLFQYSIGCTADIKTITQRT
jgi:hypothetical protein